mmetsp:Transcript_20312/g.30998  ORF Transcript_20312/g.30998 Transcript_20312/m.30998 type:complete len:246 (-) Transcript_20312:219-956(-)
MSCNRELSRIARVLLREMSSEIGGQLPQECVFNPERDVLLYQERQKKALRLNLWKCRLCGKKFVSEYFLDEHLDRKHSSETGNVTQPYCLADACDILDCASLPSLARTAFAKRLDESITRKSKRSARFAKSCNPAKFMEPEICRRVFTDCGWHEHSEHHCQALRCTGGRIILDHQALRLSVKKLSQPILGQTKGFLILLYIGFLVLYYFFYVSYRIGAFASSSFDEQARLNHNQNQKRKRSHRPD